MSMSLGEDIMPAKGSRLVEVMKIGPGTRISFVKVWLSRRELEVQARKNREKLDEYLRGVLEFEHRSKESTGRVIRMATL